MEIKLNFKEKEFRDLYESSYLSINESLSKRVRDRNKTRNVLLILSCLTLLLTFVNQDWLYYGVIVLVFTRAFIGWTEITKIKTKKYIEQNKKEVDNFVAKTKVTKGIKYSYDDNSIRYYESNEVVDTYEWKNLKATENNPDCFVLYFSNNKPTIMIPRTMVEDKEELMKLEKKISENLKNAR